MDSIVLADEIAVSAAKSSAAPTPLVSDPLPDPTSPNGLAASSVPVLPDPPTSSISLSSVGPPSENSPLAHSHHRSVPDVGLRLESSSSAARQRHHVLPISTASASAAAAAAAAAVAATAAATTNTTHASSPIFSSRGKASRSEIPLPPKKMNSISLQDSNVSVANHLDFPTPVTTSASSAPSLPPAACSTITPSKSDSSTTIPMTTAPSTVTLSQSVPNVTVQSTEAEGATMPLVDPMVITHSTPLQSQAPIGAGSTMMDSGDHEMSSRSPSPSLSPSPMGPAETTPKKARRTRTRLTVAQKVDVLRRMEKGERQSALALELGCSKRALARLKQERASFETIHLTEADTYRKSRHSVKHILLEGKLAHFLRLARRNGYPVTGNSVRRAALKLRDDLLEDPNLPEQERPGLEVFQASINWSKGFLKRCGIRTVEAKPEPIPVQQQIDNKRHLEKLLDEFDLDCIFCVDRVMLFYNLLPNESFIQPSNTRVDDQSSEAKLSDHVTVVLATNITGSVKISPTIVGSEAVPECFRQKPCKLPYLAHAYSWLDDATYKTWFYCVLLPAIRRSTSKRVAVIIDSDWAPVDVHDSNGQVQMVSIPFELSTDCHPMNVGIVSVFRRSLRYSLLNRIIRVEDNVEASSAQVHGTGQGSRQCLSRDGTSEAVGAVTDGEVTLLLLADLIEQAWTGLTESFLTKCWVRADILPEKHSRRLIQSHGAVTATSDEQMFFSCCSPAQLRSIRTIEDLIINRRLYAKDANSHRAKELVGSLHEAGRRGIESWLDVEASSRAQRALITELDQIINEYKSPIHAPKLPCKRPITDVGGAAIGNELLEKRSEQLPHVQYMLELLAPIQKLVDECESGNAALLLRNLKHELVRVKSDQEKRLTD